MNPIIITAFIFILALALTIRVVRPTHRALIERFGKFHRFAQPGLHFVIPLVDRLYKVNVTEQMADAKPQEIITFDNLNARVDAQIYFKIRSDADSVKNSQYNVNDYRLQIESLTRTILRNIIGTMTLRSANSEREKINKDLLLALAKEVEKWGLEIVRTEIKEINPPRDVQETMNKVVKAENEKVAAVDFATARETMADGEKRASIKQAEGIKQAQILKAEGEAESIRLVNEAADKYFVGNAKELRRLEATENALSNNATIVIPSNTQLVNVIGGMSNEANGLKIN